MFNKQTNKKGPETNQIRSTGDNMSVGSGALTSQSRGQTIESNCQTAKVVQRSV